MPLWQRQEVQEVLRSVNKPYSESCEQNRAPILQVLRTHLPSQGELLEIGSGTGQHAVYFAPEFPGLIWQTSDRAENHPGILAWLAESSAGNLRSPLELDVSTNAWPDRQFAAVYSANTAHIMHQADVINMFSGVGKLLEQGGVFLLYGPFNIAGQYTAPSNERFDHALRQHDPGMGVRDREWLQELAAQAGLALLETIDMPADNKLLYWTTS